MYGVSLVHHFLQVRNLRPKEGLKFLIQGHSTQIDSPYGSRTESWELIGCQDEQERQVKDENQVPSLIDFGGKVNRSQEEELVRVSEEEFSIELDRFMLLVEYIDVQVKQSIKNRNLNLSRMVRAETEIWKPST